MDDEPILHFVNEATGIHASQFIKNVVVDILGNAHRCCSIDDYLGSCDKITHDIGTHFIPYSSAASCDILYIRTIPIPVKATHLVSIFERYCVPLRRVFNIAKKDDPTGDN